MIREALMAAMMNANKNGESMQQATTNETASDTPDVNRIKSDWNDFLSWMKSKGVQGKPELDKGDLGNKYFKEYIKANPQTSLSEKTIPIIRQEYVKLRNEKAADILAGKSEFTLPDLGKLTGETARKHMDRFMGHIVKNELSEHPDYVGQHLTQTFFPGAENSEYVDGKLVRKVTTELGDLKDISEAYRKKSQQATPNATTVSTAPLKKQ